MFFRFTVPDWVPFRSTRIYSLKCQLSPPPKPITLHTLGGGDSYYRFQNIWFTNLLPSLEWALNSSYCIYIICNYSILIYSLVSLEPSTCIDIISAKEIYKTSLTVQNSSFPSKSNPWIEQFPPTMARGFSNEPSLPVTIAFAPSAILQGIKAQN